MPKTAPRLSCTSAACLLTMVFLVPRTAAAQTPPCPNPAPPPAVDSSEVPRPGATAPPPLPVPSPPVGGDLLARCDAVVPPDAPPPPAEVTADSWIVADLDTGTVLAAKDPHARERPASTIKTLTALLSVRSLRMNDTITATDEDAAQEGSRVGLQPGVTYTVRDVLTGLILNSGNDAAHALARKLGGVDVTVRRMNELAQRLGARDTRVATPSGLDGPGMSTSSYDLALIFRAALRNPDFATIATTKLAELPGHPPLRISTDNAVVRDYPGVLGGKNGFTDDAQHTFVTAAQRGGHRIVTALMHSPVQLNSSATELLNYGFALDGSAPVGRLVPEAAPGQSPLTVRPQRLPGPAVAEDSEMFGTVGLPLTALAAVGMAAVTLLAVRRRRAKLAAAARRERITTGRNRS